MPHGAIKTKEDEKKWQIAMSIVRKQYKKTDKDKDFYPIAMGVWKNMKKKRKSKKESSADVIRKVAHELMSIHKNG